MPCRAYRTRESAEAVQVRVRALRPLESVPPGNRRRREAAPEAVSGRARPACPPVTRICQAAECSSCRGNSRSGTRKNFICAEVSSEFRSCLNSITQDLPLTAASVPIRPMRGRWSGHTLIMLPGLLNVCFVRDYFLSSVLSTISWKTCPLSEVSTVRAARSLKRRMISTVPPIENHTVEITPTIPGTSR